MLHELEGRKNGGSMEAVKMAGLTTGVNTASER